MESKNLKKGWLDFKRVFFSEGYIDIWVGDAIDDPNKPKRNLLSINAFATYYRLNGKGKWISRNDHKVDFYVAYTENKAIQYDSTDFWEKELTSIASKAKKKSITKNKHTKKKKIVFKKLNGHCGYCGIMLDLKTVSIDHIIPKHRLKGYTINSTTINKLINLMPACRDCNVKKKHMDLEDFRKDTRSMFYFEKINNPNKDFVHELQVFIAHLNSTIINFNFKYQPSNK